MNATRQITRPAPVAARERFETLAFDTAGGRPAPLRREAAGAACRGFEIEPADHLRWVQRSLNRLRGLRLPADGRADGAYRQALASFQRSQGLTGSGKLDIATQNRLILRNEQRTPHTADGYVRWLQSALNQTGAGLAVDGDLGPTTRQALTAFQSRRVPDLCADGFVGAKTELRLIQVSNLWPPGQIDPTPPPDIDPDPDPGDGPEPPPPGGHVPRVTGCGGQKAEVLTQWAEALDRVARARRRLVLLGRPAHAVTRIAAWNDGPERVWFGAFTERHFAQLTRTLRRIHEVLAHPDLAISCAPALDQWGRSLPGIRHIKLGATWLNTPPTSADAYELAQTLVHEAAHIAGVVSAREDRKGGPSCARQLARQNCFKAMRNADNFGYYVLHHVVALQHDSLGPCVDAKGHTFDFPIRACT